MANKGKQVRSSGVVKPAVKTTPRLSSSVQGTRMKKNMCDGMGRMPNMSGSAR